MYFHASSTSDESDSYPKPINWQRTKRRKHFSAATEHSSSSTATPAHESSDDDMMMSHVITPEEEDMAHCLILLAQSQPAQPINIIYNCKTCDRVFPSFQALGGHRASHKKPKPNPNARSTDDVTPDPINDQYDKDDVSKSRVHECSICGSEFPSGQALGGHMRRHRPPQLPAPAPPDRPIVIKDGGPRSGLPLDLNLPAPLDDDHDDDDVVEEHMKMSFHVFPTPALVDCHY